MAEQEAEGNESLTDTLKDIGQGILRIRGVISDLAFAYPTKEQIAKSSRRGIPHDCNSTHGARAWRDNRRTSGTRGRKLWVPRPSSFMYS